ncbi:MAG: universal stress protein [Actinomycetota bacterium]
MFRTIIVGTDGSGTASTAVRHAEEIAKHSDGELIVVSVYTLPRETAGPFTDPQGSPAGIEVANGLLGDVEKHYGKEIRLRTIAREGSPSDALLDISEEEKADLIVVGNRGMTGAKRFVLGSVPNTVSHHAPCHVLIVHTTEESGEAARVLDPDYKLTLIATDGSETASRALKLGYELATALGSKILVVHVGEPARGKQVLDDAASQYKGIETLSVEGDPADKILEVAEEKKADLVIIGNKGMTGARRFLLGSVPNQVSHHAPCNVLIVKTT